VTTLILGTLLAIADTATHWPAFRWAGLALGLCAQVLVFKTWLRARRAPVAVMYACPFRCGFLGDQLACDAHAARCGVQRWAA